MSSIVSSAVVVSPVSASDSSPETDTPFLGDLPFEQRDAAKALIATITGIRVPRSFVPRGESLLPSGETKLRGLRAEYAALPTLASGLDSYSARLRAEESVDKAVKVQSIRMDPDRAGLFAEGRSSSKALAYTRAGFSHVAAFIKPPGVRNGFAENMLAMPVSLRSQWFNECAKNARGADDQVKLRTVLAPGEGGLRRVVRAVTSDRHSLETGDDSTIVGALRSLTALKGAKVRITRDGLGERSWFEVLWPAVNRQIRVGDSLAFGIRFRNSETKAGSLVVEPFLFDAICYNLTTAYSSLMNEGAFTLRHVGDLTRRVTALVIQAQKTIEPFVRSFADAYRAPFPAALPTRGDVLTRVGRVLELPESTLTLAAQLWNADGSASAGDTLAGAANALTRASQEQSMEEADRTERAAGQLIADGWAALERMTPRAA